MDKKFNLTVTPSEGQFNISNLKWTDQFGNNFSQGLDFLKQSAMEKGLSNETIASYAQDLNQFINFLYEKQVPEVSQPSQFDIDEIPQLVEKIMPYLNTANALIVSLLLHGNRIGDVLSITIGEWRTRHTFRHGANGNSKIHKPKNPFIWDEEIEEKVRKYCNNERRECDLQRRDLARLLDDDYLFLNRWGNPIPATIFQANWDMACRKAGVKIQLHLLRHYAKQKYYIQNNGGI